jgi:hypothetical protein
MIKKSNRRIKLGTNRKTCYIGQRKKPFEIIKKGGRKEVLEIMKKKMPAEKFERKRKLLQAKAKTH